jgi:molecular chaperone HscB
MTKQNFFELFGIPVSFCVNEPQLTKVYLEKMRKVHPDIVGNDGHRPAAWVNVAYRILLNPISRGKHFLQVHGEALSELSTEFAGEMFAVREAYELLTSEAEKMEFTRELKAQKTEIIEILYASENDLPKFGRYLSLLCFIDSFLEKAGFDVYCRN